MHENPFKSIIKTSTEILPVRNDLRPLRGPPSRNYTPRSSKAPASLPCLKCESGVSSLTCPEFSRLPLSPWTAPVSEGLLNSLAPPEGVELRNSAPEAAARRRPSPPRTALNPANPIPRLRAKPLTSRMRRLQTARRKTGESTEPTGSRFPIGLVVPI